MIPGMNPRKAQQMMKKMGINQQEVEAETVIIKCKDKEIVINDPQVAKVNMMGQETWQIVGQAIEQAIDSSVDLSDEDIKTVMDQANVDEATARQALDEAEGDLAKAILSLN